jgi:endonuclease/exonuclease/phosphatase family metal-dependent hydrolase
MRIYSWNMLYRNTKADEAFDFIAHADFDIFCLQEVPEDFLARLRKLPFPIASRIDVERLRPSGAIKNFNVVLTKHVITKQDEVAFPDYWSELPWRTRVFVTLMPTRFFSKIRNRGGVYVDISVEGKMIRVFNLHLVLAHPTWRLKEFETAMFKRDPALPTIVCGDFNILSARHITPLNWILGGSLGDALLPGRERTTIDKRFAEHQLTNPLSGTITQTPSYSQLDHILVSSSFSIKSAEVIPDRHGSDHHPIRVEIE